MPKYRVTDQETGKTFVLTGDSPPSEAELEEIFSAQRPGMVDKAKDLWNKAVNPPKEDFPELPYIYQGDEDTALNLYQGTDPTAQKGQDKYGNTVFKGEKGTFYPDQPGFTPRDIPNALEDITAGLKVAAPSIAGGVATAPLKVAQAAPAMFSIGAASGASREAVDSALQGNSPGQVATDALKQGAVEGAIDATGEVAGRALFHVLRPLAVRFFGKKGAQMPLLTEGGQLSDDAIKMLRTEGGGEIVEAELARMTRQGALTADEAERLNLFIKHNIQPTKAQVTRKATDFQNQQEAYKRSGEVRTALETQDAQIREGFENIAPRVEGDAYNLVRDRVDQVDDAIDTLYQQARESVPDSTVSVNGLYAKLKEATGQDRASTGLLSALKGKLKQLDAKEGISVTQAEEVRQFINSFYDSTTPQGRRLIHQFKDALDDDVFGAIGSDYFGKARAAKGQLEQSLNRASKGRRDKRGGRGLLRDVVENRVGPDEFLDKIKSKAVRPDDLADYKRFLLDQEGGQQAWDSLRREALDDIIGRAFKGATGETGVATPTKTKLDDALRPWVKKMGVLFSRDERAFFEDMGKLLSYRDPVAGTAMGHGPSAQGVQFATERILRRLPVMGDFGIDVLRLLSENVQEMRLTRQVLDTGLNSTVRGLSDAQLNIVREELRRAFSPLGGTAAGAVIAANEN